MNEKDFSQLVGEIIRNHRKNAAGKSIARREIADKLGFATNYLTQIEGGTKTSMFNFFGILSCLPEAEARGALLDVLQAFGLAGIVETGKEWGKDREKLERIRAILDE